MISAWSKDERTFLHKEHKKSQTSNRPNNNCNNYVIQRSEPNDDTINNYTTNNVTTNRDTTDNDTITIRVKDQMARGWSCIRCLIVNRTMSWVVPMLLLHHRHHHEAPTRRRIVVHSTRLFLRVEVPWRIRNSRLVPLRVLEGRSRGDENRSPVRRVWML